VCAKLIDQLRAFKISTYCTDDGARYSKLLPAEKPVTGKQYTQKIEHKNRFLRTRIKRLARKTICFSKREELHDGVIGLFINQDCYQPN